MAVSALVEVTEKACARVSLLRIGVMHQFTCHFNFTASQHPAETPSTGATPNSVVGAGSAAPASGAHDVSLFGLASATSWSAPPLPLVASLVGPLWRTRRF
jgi:hypothetical protein